MTRQLFLHHPVIGHLFVPGLRTRVEHEAGGYLVATNGSGFRCDHELLPSKDPDSFRILLCGDSFTAGDGVSNGRRWGDLLETLSPGAHVDNLAMPGTGTDQQFLIYRTYGADLEADLLVIAVYLEDVVRNMEQAHRWATPGGREQWMAKPWFEQDAQGSLVLHGTPVPPGALSVSQRPPMPIVDVLTAFDDPDHPAWQRLRAILTQWVRTAGTRTLLIPIPLVEHIDGVVAPDGYRARFAELERDLDLSVHDPLDAFWAVPVSKRVGLRLGRDPHLSPAGHRLLAESVLPTLNVLRGQGQRDSVVSPRRGDPTAGVVNSPVILPPKAPPLGPNASRRVNARPVTVLGISAYYHDSAAALVRDGLVVAAAEEERFSRRKHDAGFPDQAVNYCLGEAFIEAEDLDAVVFYDDAILTMDRVFSSLAHSAGAEEDSCREQWVRAARGLGTKPFVADHIRASLGTDVPVLIARHHASHAASAFFPSPFEEAAILTVDGVGEWASTSIARGSEGAVETLAEIHYPHSLGLLYSAFTALCGFSVNDGEYKLMGLAPYGTPRYAEVIRRELLRCAGDGSFELHSRALGWLRGTTLTDTSLHDLFGPSRKPDEPITRRECDLAASIQSVTEAMLLDLALRARKMTGSANLVLAGGVALNCVANGVLVRSGVIDRLWVQPAAGDAGGALGAALLVVHQHFGVPRVVAAPNADGQSESMLGPSYSGAEVRALLDRNSAHYEVVPDRSARAERVARALAAGRIVGLFSGRMEFGPRALGGRSLLGDPRRIETQSTLNLAVKDRESFRPFAPAVLAEHSSEWFELDGESPYMLVVAPLRPEHRRLPGEGPIEVEGTEDLFEMVRQVRSDVPAVTHVDYSARVQTVRREQHPELRAVLEAFFELTGCPMVVNTSFNGRDEPIVCSPQDAYRCFRNIGVDLLVLEDCLVEAEEQVPLVRLPFTLRTAPSEPLQGIDPMLNWWFDEHLLPAARRLRDRGVNPVAPTEQHGEQGSFFVAPPSGPVLFEDIGEGWQRLYDRWAERDLPELAELVDPLAELADLLRPLQVVDRSPSIDSYVMW